MKINYETWYGPFQKTLAKDYTRPELEKMLSENKKKIKKATESHLNTIRRSSSMQSNAQGRAHSRSTVSLYSQTISNIECAIDIHINFPEYAKK